MTMGGVCEILITHLDCNDLIYNAPCPPPFMTYEVFSVHARIQNITDGEISAIAQHCKFPTMSLENSSVNGPILSPSYYSKTTPVEDILTTESTTIDSTTYFVKDATVNFSIPYEESKDITEDKYTAEICICVAIFIILITIFIILFILRRRKKRKYELGTTINPNVSGVKDAMDMLLKPQGFIEDKVNRRSERTSLDQFALAKEIELMIDK